MVQLPARRRMHRQQSRLGQFEESVGVSCDLADVFPYMTGFFSLWLLLPSR